jgi:hypothetical protein
MFPSWTWVGWQGTVGFMFDSAVTEYRTFLRQAQLESSPGEIVELSALWEPGSHEKIQQALDTVTAIQFEAPMISADSISINGYQSAEEDNEDLSDGDADIRMFRVCGHSLDHSLCPGADVLNDLIENVRKGTWSCLVLGAQAPGSYEQHVDNFVLVVRWEEDHVTAQRISAFVVMSRDEKKTKIGPLEENMQWRRVRLM